MTGLPSFDTYGDYSSRNYGANALVFDFPRGRVWFSYKTPVAFHDGSTLVCRENDWGPTTGKHLDWIEPDKSRRVSGEEFEKRFAAAFN